MAAAETIAGPPAAPPTPRTLDTDALLLAEYASLWGPPREGMTTADYRGAVLDHGQAALCLSGGGVRSAAFALGVLQALAAKRLLTRFHYLSTVSGGGYIGGWLSRWIADAGAAEADADDSATRYARANNAEIVQERLRESIVGTTGDPPQIRRLRENANFITPRIGAASTDTWTAIALSARNIVVNWLIFGPALLLLALLFNAYEAAFLLISSRDHAAYILIGAALLLAVATFHGCRELPSYAARPRGATWLFRRVAVPSLAWALIVPLLLSPSLRPERAHPGRYPPGGYLALAAFVALLLGYLAAAVAVGPGKRRSFLRNLPVWTLAAAISAGALLLGVTLLQRVPADAIAEGGRAWRVVVLGTLGPLWIVLAQLLASNIFVAFRDVPAARPAVEEDAAQPSPDVDREWLARLSALKIRPTLLWTILATTGLLIPMLIDAAGWPQHLREWIAGAVAAVSGLVAIFGGRSAGTSSGHEQAPGVAAGSGRRLPVHALVTLATATFAVFLLAYLALVERHAAASVALGLASLLAWARLPGVALAPSELRLAAQLACALALGGLLALTSTRINVNRFSLNGMYRNRLARAFLGSARAERTPDPFTGFDQGDNIALTRLVARSGGRRVLFHVVNVALNIVGGDRLAWQERKAEPFVFTPLGCGSAMLDMRGRRDPGAEPTGAYVATRCYAGDERGPAGGDDGGASLATAIAISGAAASPSMGYHSSPATAFLMTLFNVRLGAWLPNPARARDVDADVGGSGPTNALRPLLSELAGLTNDKGRDVYLSDGGHFEDLGLYEMIRRRCRYIVVVDAGCDPDCRFEDLGNAIRKIAIDQDRVEISFTTLDIRARASQATPRFAYAIGDIRYPERPGIVAKLLYIKPSYFEPMPVDIRAYAEVHASFPHETTADQWFGESQFESYRRLGEYLTTELGVRDRVYDAAGGGLARFFRDIAPGAVPPVPSPASGLRARAARFARTLFDRAASS